MSITSIIIVNYNGKEYLLDCLYSLEQQTINDFTVILIDNNSNDESYELIEKQQNSFKFKLILKKLKENIGFAGGNIEGLKYANGKYVILLNPDTKAHPDFLKELIGAADANNSAGIFAAKLIVHSKEIIDSAGDGFTTSLSGFKRGEGEDSKLYNEPTYVFGACGGACLYKSEMIKEIGFLDEDFFLIHEDTDFNFRAQLAGWKCMYVPTAIVHHKVSAAIGQNSDLVIYYNLRNCDFVRIKNIPFLLFIRNFYHFFITYIYEFYFYIIKSNNLSLYLKAKIDVIIFLPNLLRKRRKILKNRKVSISDLQMKFTLIPIKGPLKILLNKINKLFS